MYDLAIFGGTLVDGSGAPGLPGTLYLQNGRIAAMRPADAPAETAVHTLDATGLVVAPGFIDVHTHYDAQACWDPLLSPSPFHGVTTVIGGNCGFSIAPLSGDDADAQYLKRMLARVEGMPLESLDAGVPWGSWRSFGDSSDSGASTPKRISMPIGASAAAIRNTGSVHGFINASGRYSGSLTVP